MATKETVNTQIAEQLGNLTTIGTLALLLTVEQRGALEQKFLALPQEVRSAIAADNPNLKTYEMYIVRQMRKEANGKLASTQRPIWYNILATNAASLRSGNEEIRKYAEMQLRKLADDIDAKESATILKKYKNQHDMTTADPFMVQLAGVFGVEITTLK